MEALRWLVRDEWTRLVGTFAAGSPYGAPALCGALIFTLVWFFLRRRARGRSTDLKTFVRAVFPRRILLHPSSLVDMRLWALNTLVFASGYGLLVVGAFFWRDRRVDPRVWRSRRPRVAAGPHHADRHSRGTARL